MSSNSQNSKPSDTDPSLPVVIAARDTVNVSETFMPPALPDGQGIGGRGRGKISAPGAVSRAARPSHVALPSFKMPPRDRGGERHAIAMEQLYSNNKVSGMLASVDVIEQDNAFDAAVFEKEPLATRNASCVAFATKLSDLAVQQIISKGTRVFKKVKTFAGNTGSIWIYSCSGERSPVPASEIFDEIRVASQAENLPVPSAMFVSYQGQQDVSTILNTFQQEVGSGFPLLAGTQAMFVGDEHFMRASQHPRVQVYMQVDVSTKAPRELRGKRFYDMNLTPSIHAIRAGGADKQYGREGEEKRIREWVDATFKSGAYSSMTIHGDAMMGKTRMASEIVRYVKLKYPDATLVFAPAMDTHKSNPFHYAKTFAKRLVEGFASQSVISKTMVYQQLSDFTRGSLELSLSEFSSLLITFFELLPSSQAKLLLVPDDMQWPDSESNAFLRKIFSQNARFGNMAVLNLTRTGDEVISPELLSAMKAKTSDEVSLKPLVFLDKNGEPTKMLSTFVCDLLHVPEFDVPFATDYLKRLAKLSHGNGGILTELVRGMYQDGVITAFLGKLTVDHTRFMSWTEAGEADNVIATKADRLLKNESYRDALLYFVAFRESGECDADLFLKFLTNVLKRPELVKAFSELVAQQTIGLQQISDQDEATLSFSQDLLGARLKKDFTDSGSAFAALYVGAHRDIAKFMFDMNMRIDAEKNPQLISILGRCSDRAIFTHAHAAGMEKLSTGYAIRALREAYRVGDHAATLEIYGCAVQSNPQLLAEIEADDDLQLSVLHSMTVLRGSWSETAIRIGDGLKKKYLGLLNQSSAYDPELISRIEHLYDVMCTFYFLRGTARSLRDESIKKLGEWGSGFRQDFFSHAEQEVKLREGLFMLLKESFYLMLAEYMQQNYRQACEQYLPQFEIRREDLYRKCPEAEHDPRVQRLNLEATRLGANGWLMGYNRAEVPGLEGVIFAYDDEEACIVSSRDPKSPLHDYLLAAEKLFRSYLGQAAEYPDQVMDRGQVYRAKQGFARTLGNLGKYHESFEQFLDARSDAHRYGDPERFASITDTASSMLCNMVKHFLAQPTDLEFQKIIIEIASLIRRSEQGGSADDQDMFASLQYILTKAYQYSQQAARIMSDINHATNLDTATINMLLTIETMVSSFVTFKRPMDVDMLVLLEEIMEKVLVSAPDANGKETPTFFDRVTKLDVKGGSGERWNLYVAPCLARLALESTQFDSPEVQAIFKKLLTELGDCIEGRAGLLHSLHSLIDERFTPKKARLHSYDRAVDGKLNDVRRVMTLLEQRGLMKYSLVAEY